MAQYAQYYGGQDPYAAYGGYAAYVQMYQQYYAAAQAQQQGSPAPLELPHHLLRRPARLLLRHLPELCSPATSIRLASGDWRIRRSATAARSLKEENRQYLKCAPSSSFVAIKCIEGATFDGTGGVAEDSNKLCGTDEQMPSAHE
ncbi:KH domain-containing protein [Colletotrichum higginsianum]|nr:KH domain-containing protein [Colletotrichum higginsianum]